MRHEALCLPVMKIGYVFGFISNVGHDREKIRKKLSTSPGMFLNHSRPCDLPGLCFQTVQSERATLSIRLL